MIYRMLVIAVIVWLPLMVGCDRGMSMRLIRMCILRHSLLLYEVGVVVEIWRRVLGMHGR